MSGFMHDVARAALPVAIGLLVLAATARGVLSAPVDDPPARRLARLYLGPLSTWCLGALAVYTVARGAAGEARVGSFVLPLALGAAAAVLWSMSEAAEEKAASHAAQAAPRSAAAPPARAAPAAATTVSPAAAPAPAAPAAAPPRTPAPAGRLWVDPAEEEAAGRTGLWSRA